MNNIYGYQIGQCFPTPNFNNTIISLSNNNINLKFDNNNNKNSEYLKSNFNNYYYEILEEDKVLMEKLRKYKNIGYLL